jgi:hypothetical protein
MTIDPARCAESTRTGDAVTIQHKRDDADGKHLESRRVAVARSS